MREAVSSGRLGHAWLIHGREGIGKINLALTFASTLLNASDSRRQVDLLKPEAFVKAMDARHQEYNHHPDLHWVFPEEDKRTIGVEQVRSACETLTLKSYVGGAKVVVIEPAETMTTAAANALLKTLEEPTPNSYLLLVAHRLGGMPVTVRSRCQRLRIRPPSAAVLAQWLGDRAPDLHGSGALASPLQLARALDPGEAPGYESLEEQMTGVIERRLDPIGVADEWTKRDVDHILEWLTQTLQAAIRRRSAADHSNLFTESGQNRLHNLWQPSTLRSLFVQLEKAEALRNQLGGGVNVQLALRALLLGFRHDRDVS
jgi:DNA polymerase-3 subunit delta'